MQDFRRLEVWREAHGLTLAVYKASAGFSDDERFGLTSQLRRACASIAANLAEGCGRGSDTDFARFVQVALGSAFETDYHLLLARDLGYLSEQQYMPLNEQIQVVKRMLQALLRSLRTTQPSQ
jgi:four helix bundle protein